MPQAIPIIITAAGYAGWIAPIVAQALTNSSMLHAGISAGRSIRRRPRKNPPADAAQKIEAMTAKGRSVTAISKLFGVDRATLWRWLAEDQQLREALERGSGRAA